MMSNEKAAPKQKQAKVLSPEGKRNRERCLQILERRDPKEEITFDTPGCGCATGCERL